MPIDASIPLQAKAPAIMSPLDVMNAQAGMQRNQILGLQLQEGQRAAQERNAERAAFARPESFGPNGEPMPMLLREVAQYGSPQMHNTLVNQAAALQQKAALAEQEKARAEEQKSIMYERYGKQVTAGIGRATMQYKLLQQSGLPDDLARQGAQLEWSKVRDEWKRNGAVGPLLEAAPQEFEPTSFEARATAYHDWQAQQKQQAQFQQQNAMQDRRESAAAEKQRIGLEAIAARVAAHASSGDVVGLDDTTLNYAAEMYKRTGIMPPMGQGKAGAEARKQILSRAAQTAQTGGQTVGDVLADQAGLKSDKTSLGKMIPMYDAVKSFSSNAVINGERLVQLAEKADTTGVPVLERWIRAGKKATGDPDVAACNAQMTLFRNEAAKILTNPNLTGVLTVEAMREMERSLDNASSPKQIKAVVSLLKRDFAVREKSLEDQIKEAKGRMTSKPAATSDDYSHLWK